MPKYICTNCGRLETDYENLRVIEEFDYSHPRFSPHKVLSCPKCGHDEFEIVTDDQEIEFYAV